MRMQQVRWGWGGVVLALAAGAAWAQGGAPKFAAPRRVIADGSFAGVTRRYPSPVIQDLNGDGLGDLVLGDLNGLVTVSLRLAGQGRPEFGPETPLTASDGGELKFNNW